MSFVNKSVRNKVIPVFAKQHSLLIKVIQNLSHRNENSCKQLFIKSQEEIKKFMYHSQELAYQYSVRSLYMYRTCRQHIISILQESNIQKLISNNRNQRKFESNKINESHEEPAIN